MNHALIAPILLPLVVGGTLLLVRDRALLQRGISLLSCLAQLLLAGYLLQLSTESIATYRLGDWPPPFGIVLVLDRLAALMLLTNAVLALLVLIYACAGEDRDGRYFHPLFQFQLVGINGAFLTGDLFNLFVFFEILLIASYGLLLHGTNAALNPTADAAQRDERVGSGVQYVVLNLVGSALFLFAAGTFYGVAGTLNFADLARYLSASGSAAGNAPLLLGATLLLLLVFGLKAALVPLHFWLPRSYSAAAATVAALFAIMSKIGIYALLRVQTLLLGDASILHGQLQPWLQPVGIVTLLFGAIGALASTTLKELIAYMVIVSIGTLTIALALDSAPATTALLYYLVHSTWLSASMFLLVGLIDRHFALNIALRYRRALATLFLLGAMALVGMPPLSGFIGKLLLLQSAPAAARGWFWSSLLIASFAALVAFARLGVNTLWRAEPDPTTRTTPPALPALAAVGALIALGIGLSLAAAPVVATLHATAAQLFEPQRYLDAVLHAGGQP